MPDPILSEGPAKAIKSMAEKQDGTLPKTAESKFDKAHCRYG